MENASKALIIAGAILLAIAIIGIGMYVFQMASDSTSDIGLSSEQARAYNSEFERYMGPNVRGTTVKTLLGVIRNHNIMNKNDATLQINVAGNVVSDTSSSSINTIKAGATYNVSDPEDGYDASTGYITTISIEEASK